MTFVKCDKCGAIQRIGVCDGDYVCSDLDLDSEDYIDEEWVDGKKYDICRKCYSELRNRKQAIEKEFLKEIEANKENNNAQNKR